MRDTYYPVIYGSGQRPCHAELRKTGFTLTELLVVMVITMLLAALTLAAIGQASASARATGCLSTMHSFGVALHEYVADNQGILPMSNFSDPGHGEVNVALGPYLLKTARFHPGK